jgi:hypothetical protein
MLTYVTAWEKLNSTNASPPEIGHDGNSVAGEHYRNSLNAHFDKLLLSHPVPLPKTSLPSRSTAAVSAAGATGSRSTAAAAPAAAAAAAAAATRAAPPAPAPARWWRNMRR